MADSRTESEQEALVKRQEEKTIVQARNFARLGQVFEISALVLTVVGVLAAILIIADSPGDSVAKGLSVAIGLAILMFAGAVGATLWAAARGMRLFGEYVAIRVWRYPRQLLTTAGPSPIPSGESPTARGPATIPNQS